MTYAELSKAIDQKQAELKSLFLLLSESNNYGCPQCGKTYKKFRDFHFHVLARHRKWFLKQVEEYKQ